MTREQFTAKFGRGGCRPLPIHVIQQHDEWRTIDDGKRSRTNPLSTVSETIVNIPATITILITSALAVTLNSAFGKIPGRFHVQAAVEDWWKGYRQLFPARKHMAHNVIAVLHPQK